MQLEYPAGGVAGLVRATEMGISHGFDPVHDDPPRLFPQGPVRRLKSLLEAPRRYMGYGNPSGEEISKRIEGTQPHRAPE